MGKIRLSAGRKPLISVHSEKRGSATMGLTGVVPWHQMSVNIFNNEWYTWKSDQGCHPSHQGQNTAFGRQKSFPFWGHSYKRGSATMGLTGVVPQHQMAVNICNNAWYTWNYDQGWYRSHYGQNTAVGKQKITDFEPFVQAWLRNHWAQRGSATMGLTDVLLKFISLKVS